MKRSEVREALEAKLPELTASYGSRCSEWQGEDIPHHVVLGDLLVTAIEKAVEDRDRDLLSRLMAFVECLASSEEVYLQEVAANSVLEVLDADTLKASRTYMGPASKGMADATEDFVKRSSYKES